MQARANISVIETLARAFSAFVAGVTAFVALYGHGFVAAMSATSSPLDQIREVREPAVAGAFYSADARQLRDTIERYLSVARPAPLPGRLRALVVPHAGYEYSGPVAAYGYKALREAIRTKSGVGSPPYRRVLILAPSHFADFNGGAVTPAHYRTPLGEIPLDPLAADVAAKPPFAFRPPAVVEAPKWVLLKRNRAEREERPDTYEHSLEVQLPFLQVVLGEFTLVPIVCGRLDPKHAAEVLAPYVAGDLLVIASSDLSHYHPYEVARSRDTECVHAICDLDTDRMRRQEACGKIPILILMELAKRFDWKPTLLDYRNSGDTSGLRQQGVVGYAAIAFCERSGAPDQNGTSKGDADHGVNPTPHDDRVSTSGTAETTQPLTLEDGRLLVRLARQTVENVVRSGQLPVVKPAEFPPKFHEPKGCFVTLTKHGELRGCIGQIFPREPLYRSVISSAKSAALEDPRFPPVQAHELSEIEIEVSVLTVPKPLAFASPDDLLAKLQPHRDGVVLKIGHNMATFLPQVWEQLPRKDEFLAHLSRKAGCAPDAWRGKNVEVQIYHVQAFEESQFAKTD